MNKSRWILVGMTAVLLALTFGGCPNPTSPRPPETPPPVDVSGPGLTDYLTAPVKGAEPTTAIETDDYTGSIEWQDDDGNEPDGNFAASTVYNAVLYLKAKVGFSFDGVTEKDFSYSGAESVSIEKKRSGSITVIISFPATADEDADTPVNALSLTKLVVAPVAGRTPDTTAIDTTQYTGSINWQDDDGNAPDGNFSVSTVYKAVLTLTAKGDFTFIGVAADAFVYTGAESVTNDADSGTVVIVFPATEALGTVNGITGTAGNGQVTLNWTNPTDEALDYIEISWTPEDGTDDTPDAAAITHTVTGLANGTKYTFTLTAVDAAGNKSAGTSVTAIPVAPVDALNLTALVIAPVKAAAPDTTEIDANQYTGTIEWKKADDSDFTGNFGASSMYKAVITLAAKSGFTFTGVAKNSFKHDAPSTFPINEADSGTVTITFPYTEALGTVSGITGTAGSGQVTLNWTNPAEADLDHVEISWTPGDGSYNTPDAATAAYTVTGLTNGTAYTFTLTAVDAEGNRSAGVDDALTPLAPPAGLVTVEFDGLPQDETIDLTRTPDALSWKAKTALTVSVGERFDAYRWALDGAIVPEKDGNSLTLNAEALSVRQHSLTVFVKIGGVEYAKALIFTVTP